MPVKTRVVGEKHSRYQSSGHHTETELKENKVQAERVYSLLASSDTEAGGVRQY